MPILNSIPYEISIQLTARLLFHALFFFVFILNAPDLHVSPTEKRGDGGVVTNNNGISLREISVIARIHENNSRRHEYRQFRQFQLFTRIPGGPYSFTFSNVGYETRRCQEYNIQENAPLSLTVK
jgi:hypothetical protein